MVQPGQPLALCGFWPSNPAGAFPRPSLGFLVKQADHSVEQFREGVPHCPIHIP